MERLPGQQGRASEQPCHKLLEALLGCRGSSISFSQEGRLLQKGGIARYGSHGGWHQVDVGEEQTCSCRRSNDFSWPQATTQRPLPAAASIQTNPAFPQVIK